MDVTASPRPLSLQSLHPGNFAFVMATGILAVALDLHGWRVLAQVLEGIAIGAWLLLLALSMLRVLRYRAAVGIDLRNPRMVFAYFTLVAATSVVGLLLLNRGHQQLALACWALAFLAWASLLYLAFAVLTFLSHEHNVNIVHGGWLITIVGTQSLVLLGGRLAPQLGIWTSAMFVEVHLLWGLGLILYGIFVTLFCYRIFFLSLKPQDVSPLLWVVMGAAAISTNAGTTLITQDPQLPFLLAQRPFIDGITLMIWGWATWWVPLLAMFFIWKHGVHRLPLHYEPVQWSFVFPLGMYAVASSRLGLAADFPPLQHISHLMLVAALLAWTAVLTALLRRTLGQIRATPAQHPIVAAESAPQGKER
ncbi:tellurite resistance/C4-dicarboxylate transporter family protein [Paucibacter soli]|uniref:tellurite resistance/C4-dicarboxylate transporter family protein n=1 Tax=Paucibacter soli TaxID=3133433 RepID=UPI0030B2F8A7